MLLLYPATLPESLRAKCLYPATIERCLHDAYPMNVQGPVAEFNIQTDPEAAKIVFESGVDCTMMPLEVWIINTITSIKQRWRKQRLPERDTCFLLKFLPKTPPLISECKNGMNGIKYMVLVVTVCHWLLVTSRCL